MANPIHNKIVVEQMDKIHLRAIDLANKNWEHDEICSQICDDFQCWAASHHDGTNVIPNWVIYLVTGVMRDLSKL